jgi:predicted branched-subunit amino acid permease
MLILFYILTVLTGIVVLGWLTRFSIKYIAFLVKNGKISLRPAFRGFKEKIWMTIGLGIVFFGFYFGIVLLSSKFSTPETRQDFFRLIYSHPIEFIYLGLFIFATITLCIYLVRMLIKYLFITKSRQ